MYTKPTLQQFGSFRDLTLFGNDRDGDLGVLFGIGGCDAFPGPSCSRS